MTSPSRPQTGKLIVIEGLDGVGKTTQARLLAENLTRRGLPVVLTREPTAGVYGQKIRKLFSHGRGDLTPEAELELFIADRRQHVLEVIKPGLARGAIIVTDRYYFSSMAYQGALGLDSEEIRARHAEFAPQPDLVILLEVPMAELSRRLQQRGGPLSHSFENPAYLAKVAEQYERLEGPNIIRLDGTGAEAEVQARILAAVCRFCQLPAAAEATGQESPRGGQP